MSTSVRKLASVIEGSGWKGRIVPAELPRVRSMVIVAVPTPPMWVVFRRREETTFWMERTPTDRLLADTATKLKSLEINEDYRLLCRNLSMILH